MIIVAYFPDHSNLFCMKNSQICVGKKKEKVERCIRQQETSQYNPCDCAHGALINLLDQDVSVSQVLCHFVRKMPHIDQFLF